MFKRNVSKSYDCLLIKSALTVFCAVAYLFAFKLNFMLFESLKFSDGVNWVFIPSGLRMLLVLVLLYSGSIGIALASCLINYMIGHEDQHLFNIVTAIISGFSPLIAREICLDFLQLQPSLSNLTSRTLFQLSIVFSVISALLHQVWFYWNNATENFIASSLVMALGDWVGTVMVLATASLLLKLKTSLPQRNKS
jgi:hypothetical protein